MLIPTSKTLFGKRTATSLLVLFFAFVGMLVSGANSQAGSPATDYKFNKNDPAPLLLVSNGLNLALVVEETDDTHSFDSPAIHGFSDFEPDRRLVGLQQSVNAWPLPQPGALHLRPPLRAPPIQ